MTSRALLGQLSDVELRLLRVFRSVVESGVINLAMARKRLLGPTL